MLYKSLKPHLTSRNLINMIAVIIIGYLLVATIGVIGKNYQLQKEVDALEGEIEFLELRNNELEYEIAYYQTDAFADREARDKLGLQAPGEQVVIFPKKVPPLLPLEDKNPDQAVVERAFSNLEQWLYFLFKKNPSQN